MISTSGALIDSKVLKCLKVVRWFLRAGIRRIFSACIKLLRRLPHFAALEHSIYVSIELRMCRADLRANTLRIPSFLLHRNIIRQSLEANDDYRIIDTSQMTNDELAFLENQSFSLEYVKMNKYFIPSPCETEEFFWPTHSWQPDRTFQRAAIEEGAIAAVCPRSGAVLYSTKSLLVERNHTIFYRFCSHAGTFYLAVGREVKGYARLYLYFPTIRTVVLLEHRYWAWLGRWELDIFRASMIARWRQVMEYITNDSNSIRCLLVDQHHFAHHMWNSLTGLNETIKRGETSHVDEILVTAEPMGPIDRIFPELEMRKVRRTSDDELIQAILKGNRFVVRSGGTIVTRDMIERLHRIAEELLPVEMVEAAKTFRKTYWPILWATIRTRNRTWVSQAEGIAQIANKLKQRYNGFALIVDGYGIPWDQVGIKSHQLDLIQQEEEVVRRMISLLDDGIAIRVNVGSPMLESVLYSRCIDVYLAHHGSLQNKVAWLSNRPGVVHGNKIVLAGINGTKRYYAAFASMIGSVQPIYLDPNVVVDVPGAIQKKDLRWNDSLENYDFDYNHAYVELLRILDVCGNTP